MTHLALLTTVLLLQQLSTKVVVSGFQRLTSTPKSPIAINEDLQSKLSNEIRHLISGSDIRGTFLFDDELASGSRKISGGALTPIGAYCLGYAFARDIRNKKQDDDKSSVTRICIGRDPRDHGAVLSKFVAAGVRATGLASVLDCGIASTPSMFDFCRSNLCDGGLIITASHLPADRNGMKFYSRSGGGGYSNAQVKKLVDDAIAKLTVTKALQLDDTDDTQQVDYMNIYARHIKDALYQECCLGLEECDISDIPLPLAGLRVVLNAGNGAGGFFYNVLHELGADVNGSIGIEPNSSFPNGIPNPEYHKMVSTTIERCEEVNADIGVMLDTDADRCGLIVPRVCTPAMNSGYEPLNRNRLIALLSVVFSSSEPGSTIVTDSVTSEGLADFLTKNLGLKHVRYLKGYFNVISKAKALSQSGINAAMAIETSGHCAMKENDYLDDGTYTAVKVIGLLARVRRLMKLSDKGEQTPKTLFDLISGMKEMNVVEELRMSVLDGSLQTTEAIFQNVVSRIGAMGKGDEKYKNWDLDAENLEGVRVRVGNDGTFFMLRKSLHDPLISLQIEGSSHEDIRLEIVKPIISILSDFSEALELQVLEEF